MHRSGWAAPGAGAGTPAVRDPDHAVALADPDPELYRLPLGVAAGTALSRTMPITVSWSGWDRTKQKPAGRARRDSQPKKRATNITAQIIECGGARSLLLSGPRR